MTTSVALCTYNGASYIREQIESILNQTLPVNEIVICDDGSTDDTLQILLNNRLFMAFTNKFISFFIKKHEFSGDCLTRAQFVKYRIKRFH